MLGTRYSFLGSRESQLKAELLEFKLYILQRIWLVLKYLADYFDRVPPAGEVVFNESVIIVVLVSYKSARVEAVSFLFFLQL